MYVGPQRCDAMNFRFQNAQADAMGWKPKNTRGDAMRCDGSLQSKSHGTMRCDFIDKIWHTDRILLIPLAPALFRIQTGFFSLTDFVQAVFAFDSPACLPGPFDSPACLCCCGVASARPHHRRATTADRFWCRASGFPHSSAPGRAKVAVGASELWGSKPLGIDVPFASPVDLRWDIV